MILDSGKRESYASGAVRDTQEGKGRCDLLPLDCLCSVGENRTAMFCLFFELNNFKETGDYSFVRNALRDFIDEAYGGNSAEAYLELAKHYEDGAKKYGDNNWQQGLPVSRYLSSAIRHYLKYLRGDTDEPHARAVLWNLTAIIWTCKHKPEFNDYAPKGEVADDK